MRCPGADPVVSTLNFAGEAVKPAIGALPWPRRDCTVTRKSGGHRRFAEAP